MARFVIICGLTLAACVGCFGSEERSVVYDNESAEAVTLFFDGAEVSEIAPDDEISVAVRRNTLPNFVQIRSTSGRILYEQTETWEYLEERRFRVTIDAP